MSVVSRQGRRSAALPGRRIATPAYPVSLRRPGARGAGVPHGCEWRGASHPVRPGSWPHRAAGCRGNEGCRGASKACPGCRRCHSKPRPASLRDHARASARRGRPPRAAPCQAPTSAPGGVPSAPTPYGRRETSWETPACLLASHRAVPTLRCRPRPDPRPAPPSPDASAGCPPLSCVAPCAPHPPALDRLGSRRSRRLAPPPARPGARRATWCIPPPGWRTMLRRPSPPRRWHRPRRDSRERPRGARNERPAPRNPPAPAAVRQPPRARERRRGRVRVPLYKQCSLERRRR